MGRFYNTSDSQYLDFMYKEPQHLMLQAVKQVDQEIAAQEKAAGDLYGRLKFNALNPDKQRREKIITGYKGEIDQLSRDIQANPLAYRKDMSKIRQLSDKILDDIQRGEIAAIEGNYNTRIAFKKQLDEQVKSGQIDSVEKDKLLKFYDDKYLGADYQGISDYNVYSTGNIAPQIDLYKQIDERGKGWNDDLLESWGWSLKEKGDGKYVVTTKKGDREITEQELRTGLKKYLKSDPSISSYLSTRIQHDIFSEKQANKLLNDALDYAVIKFQKHHHTESGTAKESQFALAEHKKSLEEPAIPLDRNLDGVSYGTLLGNNSQSYQDAENYLIAANSKFKNTKEGLLGKDFFIKQQAKYKFDVTKPLQDQMNTFEGKSYLLEKKTIDDAFMDAQQTGNYDKVYSLLKSYGYNPDKKEFDRATKEMEGIAIQVNNYNSKKESVKKSLEQSLKESNPDVYNQKKTSGELDFYLEQMTASYFNSPVYNQTSTTIYESQDLDLMEGFTNNQLQNQYINDFLGKLEKTPLDFFGTGGGEVKLLNLDGTLANADMNTMIEQNKLRFEQKDMHRWVDKDLDGDGIKEQVKEITGIIDGKEVKFHVGNVFHTYTPVPGMENNMKFKQRIMFTNPKDNRPVVMNIVVPEGKKGIPLPDKFEFLKNNEKLLDANAKDVIERAKGNNRALSQDQYAGKSEYIYVIPESKGAVKVKTVNGEDTFLDHRDNEISEVKAMEVIKLMQSEQK